MSKNNINEEIIIEAAASIVNEVGFENLSLKIIIIVV